MEFICEEDPNSVADSYYGAQDNWFGVGFDQSEAPSRDTASIVNQLTCQEAQARKSDLQLACRLDELANSLRSGTPTNFDDEAAPHNAGQSLSEFLCVLEKRLIEKSQSQEEACQDGGEPNYNLLYPPTASKTPSPRMRRGKSPAKRLNFSQVTQRPGASQGTPRPGTSAMRSQPSTPDFMAMLHDSNEIVCYPSERLNMYGLTAGDIWKRRAEEKAGCKCASPPRATTPVRQVQAIPIRCIPATPKFDEEESLLSTSDLRNPEYCGCTVEDILRKKAKKRSNRSGTSSSDDPSWRRRKLDDSSFWKSKRHHHSRKHSPSRSKCSRYMDDREPSPDFSDSDEWLLNCLQSGSRKKTEDSPSKKGASCMTSEEWLPKSRSNSSMCCCDDLAQRVAEWTESQFGKQNDKAINAGINCRTMTVNKPMLKRKPTKFRTNKLRESSYQTFVSGVSQCSGSSPKPCSSRRALECLECSSPEVMAFMRERSRRTCSPHRSRNRNRCPKTPANRCTGFPRKPTPMKLHLVPPPLSYQRMDDYEF